MQKQAMAKITAPQAKRAREDEVPTGWGDSKFVKTDAAKMDDALTLHNGEDGEEEDEVAEKDDGTPIESTTPDLSPQEVRRIVNNIKFWASTAFVDDMAASCRLASRDHNLIVQTIHEIVQAARTSLTNKPFAKKVTFKYKGVVINATNLVQRLNEMEALAKEVHKCENPRTQFKLTYELPPWEQFKQFWGPQDDELLAVGVVLYGLGNLDKIRNDNALRLNYKISSPSALGNRSDLPSAAQICERVNLIIRANFTPPNARIAPMTRQEGNPFSIYEYVTNANGEWRRNSPAII